MVVELAQQPWTRLHVGRLKFPHSSAGVPGAAVCLVFPDRVRSKCPAGVPVRALWKGASLPTCLFVLFGFASSSGFALNIGELLLLQQTIWLGIMNSQHVVTWEIGK